MLPSSLRFLLKPLIIILTPTLACAIYWAFFYTPGYEATVIAVPRSGERPVASDAAGAMLGSALRSKDIDSNMVEPYLLSAEMLAKLDADLDLRTHFSAPSINAFQRLAKDAPDDTFLEYYRDRVQIVVDSSSLIHVQVTAYDPDFALKLTDRILFHAEKFLNHVSVLLAEKQVDFIQGEVTKAEQRLRAGTEKLSQHQASAGQLDPTRTSADLMGIIAGLEAELAKTQASLAGRLTVLSSDAPQLTADRARISSIAEEISRLRTRLSSGGTDNATGLAGDIVRHSEYLIETEFAAKTYASALLALQTAQAEAAFNVRTLVVISRPATLSRATYPRTLYWTLTVFALTAITLLMFNLIYDSVTAHIDR